MRSNKMNQLWRGAMLQLAETSVNIQVNETETESQINIEIIF